MAAAFKVNLRLTQDEDMYFDYLLRYSQAQRMADRNALGAKLIQMQKSFYAQTEISQPVESAEIYGPVLLALMTFSDLPKEAKVYADLLNVDEAVVGKTLKAMVEQGLIKFDLDKKISPVPEAMRIPSQLGNASLIRFYEHWIDGAKASLRLPVELRRVRALKFALSPNEFAQALEQINQYAVGLLANYHNNGLSGRRLYMYQTALFPLTELFDSNLVEAEPTESGFL